MLGIEYKMGKIAALKWVLAKLKNVSGKGYPRITRRAIVKQIEEDLKDMEADNARP